MDNLRELEREIVACRKCPRLVAFREQVAREKRKQFQEWEYWGKPVPGFGDPHASVLIVGLAPAPHGGNRTGRVFTGDRSGDFLIRALHKAGFANQPVSQSRSDGLALRNAYLTASVRCAPPDNKPSPLEVENCSPYLSRELSLLKETRVILCLGQLAFKTVMDTLAKTQEVPRSRPKFAHGLVVSMGPGAPTVIASYHPSPRNTQTGRLTKKMFHSLLARIQRSLRTTRKTPPTPNTENHRGRKRNPRPPKKSPRISPDCGIEPEISRHAYSTANPRETIRGRETVNSPITRQPTGKKPKSRPDSRPLLEKFKIAWRPRETKPEKPRLQRMEIAQNKP